MELRLSKRTMGDQQTIVDCFGQIIYGDEATALRDAVKRLIAEGSKQVTLNLSGVTYIDSGGLGTIVGLYKSALDAGCDLNLANPTKRVTDLLRITNLFKVLDVQTIDASGLESLPKAG